MRIQNCRIYY